MKNSPHTDWRDKVADTMLHMAFLNQLADQKLLSTTAGIMYQCFHCDPLPFNTPCWQHDTRFKN